jgi:hypothetical protein
MKLLSFSGSEPSYMSGSLALALREGCWSSQVISMIASVRLGAVSLRGVMIGSKASVKLVILLKLGRMDGGVSELQSYGRAWEISAERRSGDDGV